MVIGFETKWENVVRPGSWAGILDDRGVWIWYNCGSMVAFGGAKFGTSGLSSSTNRADILIQSQIVDNSGVGRQQGK
jgi:hypothetical protein